LEGIWYKKQRPEAPRPSHLQANQQQQLGNPSSTNESTVSAAGNHQQGNKIDKAVAPR
jgi:hypothetical protein